MRFACLVLVLIPAAVLAQEPLLRPGDRVAIVGGTFVERVQTSGIIEAELQCRRPDWRLSVRNLGWSGDDVHGIARKRFDGPEDGYKRLLADVQTADPTVVLVAFGFHESSDGAEAVDRFEPGLRRLVKDLGHDNRRVILIAPIGMPGFRVENYDQWVSRCRGIVERVGRDAKVPVISIQWSPREDELTEDRLLPNDKGYATFAQRIAEPLVGGSPCEGTDARLAELIAAKNQLFFHRYRPQNETYLFLFRKHEQGNNAVEIPQFDPLIRQADADIWEAANK